MAFSKSALYPLPLHEQAIYARALSHPERLSTMFILKKYGTLCVSDLVKHSPLHMNSVSQHLAILRRQGLVSYEEKFPYTLYTLDEDKMLYVELVFNQYFSIMKEPSLMELR